MDIRYTNKDYKFNFYLERELVKNIKFRDEEQFGTVFWMGIERSIDTGKIENIFKKTFGID